ncbi:hypothetical protein F0292_07785 [Shigella flexneri]|nr:hypothetical protein [Escherichia coli]EFW2102432.1 hypothetical protein [Shigella flexneri]
MRLTVDLLWIPTRLVCNLRQAPGGTRHHNFMLCVVLAVPVCTIASGWYRPFYKTEKSITGRRAHNPIHPSGCHRRCSSLFCGETNRPYGGIYGNVIDSIIAGR